IFDNYHLALDKRKSIAKEYNSLLETIDRNIEAISDAEEATQFVEWIGQVEHIWDSKLQAGRRFQDRIKALGLTRQEDGTYTGGNANPAQTREYKAEKQVEKVQKEQPKKPEQETQASNTKVRRTPNIPNTSSAKV